MEIQVAFSSHGQQILGVLHTPEKTPAPGVILCHGFTGHKAEAHRLFVVAARDFAARGLTALRFDFRGCGDSEGEFRETTVSSEVEDAGAAMGFLASRPEAIPERLGVLGLSLGGCVAACLAGRDPRVRALVLWAAVAHPGRIRDRLMPALGAGDVLDMQGWDVGRGLVEEMIRVDPLKEAGKFVGPSLVIHGTGDETVPPADAADYRVALGGRSHVHLVAGADHVFSSFAYKAEVIATSRDFLLESL